MLSTGSLGCFASGRARHDEELLVRRNAAHINLVAADPFACRVVRICHIEWEDEISAVVKLSSDPEYKALALSVG